MFDRQFQKLWNASDVQISIDNQLRGSGKGDHEGEGGGAAAADWLPVAGRTLDCGPGATVFSTRFLEHHTTWTHR